MIFETNKTIFFFFFACSLIYDIDLDARLDKNYL